MCKARNLYFQKIQSHIDFYTTNAFLDITNSDLEQPNIATFFFVS